MQVCIVSHSVTLHPIQLAKLTTLASLQHFLLPLIRTRCWQKMHHLMRLRGWNCAESRVILSNLTYIPLSGEFLLIKAGNSSFRQASCSLSFCLLFWYLLGLIDSVSFYFRGNWRKLKSSFSQRCRKLKKVSGRGTRMLHPRATIWYCACHWIIWLLSSFVCMRNLEDWNAELIKVEH